MEYKLDFTARCGMQRTVSPLLASDDVKEVIEFVKHQHDLFDL